MFFLLVGEGHTDLGLSCDTPGPLVTALKSLANAVTQGQDLFSFDYVGKNEIEEELGKYKGKSSPKSISLRGSKKKFGDLVFIERKANALGRIAKRLQEAMGENGTVLFHDCDYTRSAVSDQDCYYKQMVCCIENGFAQARYRNGVAMIPKPRSESWFLCHYQETPYQNCQRFEKLPGNDASKNSGKKLLAQFFHCPESEIYDHINAEDVEWNRIDAPSFVFFKKRFQHVVQRLTHQPVTVPEPETLMSQREEI